MLPCRCASDAHDLRHKGDLLTDIELVEGLRKVFGCSVGLCA